MVAEGEVAVPGEEDSIRGVGAAAGAAGVVGAVAAGVEVVGAVVAGVGVVGAAAGETVVGAVAGETAGAVVGEKAGVGAVLGLVWVWAMGPGPGMTLSSMIPTRWATLFIRPPPLWWSLPRFLLKKRPMSDRKRKSKETSRREQCTTGSTVIRQRATTPTSKVAPSHGTPFPAHPMAPSSLECGINERRGPGFWSGSELFEFRCPVSTRSVRVVRGRPSG